MDGGRSSRRGIVMAWVASGAVFAALAPTTAAAGQAAAANPKQQMIAVLAADGPSPALGDAARLWDRFVGTWDADFGFHAADGTVKHVPGELDFGWVMEGRALQDLWISYPHDGEAERGIGTSIRWYDSKEKTWHVLFVNPRYGTLQVAGGMEGDRIVLRGNDGDGSNLRWSFNDLQADSFTWRGERSRDGGKTWTLEEEHHMRRRLASAAAAPSPTESAKSALAFERLAGLVGRWHGVIGGTDVDVEYTLTADGSALMEEFRPKGGPAMVTMFTVDGDHLVATHYCSAKNQPQMASAAIADPDAKSVAFSLVRVTGLHSSDDWHNTGLVVTLEDHDHLTQDWTYLSKGDTGKSTFHFTRAR
jgi:hypothetical protein